MKIQIVNDYQQLSEVAANLVAGQVILNNNPVLGLATGSTPEGMYHRLVQMCRNGVLDFSNTTTFNLDEYLGLSPDHPQSYHFYMYRHFFHLVNVPPQNIHLPPGLDSDPSQACRLYDRKISEAGGINLQILGIGVNGHIGFNEPHNYLKTGTHLVELEEETVEANSRFFDSPEEVPRRAITMGMRGIMQAEKIVLLASGENKARAMKEATCGKISTRVPASFLQLHRNAIFIVDREAAALL